jgi:ketosteroid isomerase-like protein
VRRGPQHRRDLLKTLVSTLVAVAVVEGFEVIDVDHQQRERLMSATGSLPLLLKEHVEAAAIGQAGHRIDGGHLFERGVCDFELCGALEQLRSSVLEKFREVPLAAFQMPDVQKIRSTQDRRRECQKQPHERAIIACGPDEMPSRPRPPHVVPTPRLRSRFRGIMRLMLLQLFLLVVALSVQPSTSLRSAADELLEADRGFSRAGAGKSVVASLLPMFADGVVLPVGSAFVEGRAQAEAALRQNPDNLTGRVEWAPIRAGLSADGQQGFTFGYMTVTKEDGTKVPMKYLAYWVRQEEGWRVATYRRRPRPEGAVSLDMMPASVPKQATPASSDGGLIEQHRKSLAAAERAFSDEAQKIGLAASFTKYGREDAVNLGGPKAIGFVVGSAAIGRAVGEGTPTDSSPVSWAADHKVIVASSGDLGVTFGYIRSNDKKDQPAIPFFTIWRRENPSDPWRYIAE